MHSLSADLASDESGLAAKIEIWNKHGVAILRHFPILADVSKQLDETPSVTTASEIPSAVFALVKDQILLASTEMLEVMFADYKDCAVEKRDTLKMG